MKKRCLYCGCVGDALMERDHFPVPNRHGGEVLVWACRPCHDRKDRMPFDMVAAERQFLNWWHNGTTEDRIIIAKMFALMLDAINSVDRWSELEAILDAGGTITHTDLNLLTPVNVKKVYVPVEPWLEDNSSESSQLVTYAPPSIRRRKNNNGRNANGVTQ